MDHVVERGLAAGREDPERDRRVRRREPRRPACPRRDAGPHRRGRLRRRDALSLRDAIDVAGVPSHVLRIGFVGEMGYEIHFPSAFGEHLWDAILEAGRPFGIVPFGLEAQRILRLEKQHILVGQDTDAESDPYEAGLGWMVKDDKADFLGSARSATCGRPGPRNGWSASSPTATGCRPRARP